MDVQGNRPNIMVIHCHDLGRHLGCYGWDVRTPNIDRLAAGGALFTNHYSTAATCSPSRGSRMTGIYPLRNGMWGHAQFGWSIDAGIRTIAEYLSETGYETCSFGFQLSANEEKRGFTRPIRSATNSALDVVPKVLQFIEEYDGSGGPFYADIGFDEVHRVIPLGGFIAGAETPRSNFPRYVNRKEDPEAYRGQVVRMVEHPIDAYQEEYDPDRIRALPYLPDLPGIRQDLADLYTVITSLLDEAVGQILDALHERGLEEDTLVIFTTDHGIDIPRSKGSLYDAGMGTAFVVRYPRSVPAGVRHDELISNVDMLPTLLELAGGAIPPDLDGRSFLPLLLGGEYRPRKQVWAESSWHGTYFALRAIRTERFKYIRNFFVPHAFEINSTQSLAGRAVLAQAYESKAPLEELYDLERDPHEQNNLAPPRTMHDLMDKGVPVKNSPLAQGDPAYKETVLALSEEMRHYMAMTKDPLLTGPVPHIAQHLIWERF